MTAVLKELPLIVHDADLNLALEASALLSGTQTAGLSLGDRFCLALAKRVDRPVLTADRPCATIAAAVGLREQLTRWKQDAGFLDHPPGERHRSIDGSG